MTTEPARDRLVPILRDIGLAHVFSGLAAVLPALSVVSAIAASVVLIAMTALAGIHIVLRERLALHWNRLLIVLAGVFLLYATVSAAWAPAPAEALWTGFRLIALFAGGFLVLAVADSLGEKARTMVRRALLIGLSVGGIFFAIELMSGGAITYVIRDATEAPPKAFSVLYNRTGSVFALLIWPCLVVLFLRQHYIAAVAAFAATCGLIWQTESGASVLGLSMGAMTMAGVWLLGGRGGRWIALALGATVICAPLIVAGALALPSLEEAIAGQGSFGHRMRIWEYATGMIANHPVLGLGLDASRHLATGGTGTGANADLMPLHPHNVPIQIWLELGAIGALIGAAFFAAVCRAVASAVKYRSGRAILIGAIVCATCIIGLSYGAWQWWWLSTLWLVAAISCAVLPARTGEPGS